MALPVNATPIYTLKVPSTKKPFKFRPFLVKDEKALLIAQESDDVSVMLDTVKDVIKACAKSEIDVENLASFDIEYIFLQMRSKSIGEIVELTFACDVDHGTQNDQARSRVVVNIDDIKVEFPEGHTNNIALFGDVGVMMKYPTIDTLKRLEQDVSTTDAALDIIADCIDYIYDGEQIFTAKDCTKKDLLDFLDNLTSVQLNNIQNFFRTMPVLRTYIKYTCPVCGLEHNKYMEGLTSFF